MWKKKSTQGLPVARYVRELFSVNPSGGSSKGRGTGICGSSVGTFCGGGGGDCGGGGLGRRSSGGP